MTLCETSEDPLAPWPPDYLAVFIRYTATFRCEARFTGGNIQRAAVTHDHEDALVYLFDAEDLRSEAAVRKELRKLLELAERYGYRTADDGGEDAFVPPGLVDRILAGAAAVPAFADNDDDPDLWTVRHICDVSIEVDVTNVYDETKALILLCSAVSGPGRRDVGSQQCAACTEELAADDATSFPKCSHAFHGGCILDSLRRAPTCPACRHDLMQYLPHQCGLQ
ncbi:hypothetical protein BRADI_3g29490v3 [Brachypodium distachyon]|uniref:RING-type E3 ubiquitin transferase n=1 Tax=Brachypodium distachyon TaxID=15368 RepID=A0A0Q3Q6C2_BRADI|nr:hypothetical protein BRADI_3g29490v3 [Brachypodium distachyon]